jgi:hypothetical protein
MRRNAERGWKCEQYKLKYFFRGCCFSFTW